MKTLLDLNLLLSFLSGIFLTLAFPKWNLWLVAFLGLIPLFWSLSLAKSSIKAFIYGFGFGFFHFTTLLYWIVYTLTKYGGLNLFFSMFLLLIVSAYLALFYALGLSIAYRCQLFNQPTLVKGFLVSFVWVGIEWLRANLLTGFPWGQIGYVAANFSPLLQLAEVGGVWVLSFFLVWVNYFGFLLLTKTTETKNCFKVLINPHTLAFCFLTVLLLFSGFYLKVRWEKLVKEETKEFKIALLQGNIPQEIKESKQIEISFQVYRNLALNVLKEKPDLILFPETAFNFYFPYETKPTAELLLFLDELKNEGKKFNLVPRVVFGTFRLSYTQGQPKAYNSLIVWDGKDFVDFYDKVKLVPFGEYVPLLEYFPFLKKISVVTDVLKPGFSKNLYLPLDNGFIKATPLICFESAFGEILRERLKENTQLVYIATNDAWFGQTSAPYQHFQMAVVRAVEARRFTVQVANSGISGIIDPTGKILTQTPLEKEAVITHTVKPLYQPTLFTKTGPILGIVGFGILALMGLVVILPRRYLPNL
ncbi:apolipoprotein N-acyltransferase [Thermodesulfobacterium sp. TA1]|uniref:apolipoprotein N-acyltransferase n=1 Tax=Thermodesulfobacterium sp. TA1 TaxID=2234087 RepID=UPI001232A4E4|nr:apolipoprotein N-acyltransferase [Thermodesulfobacterium sp. TA1]QER42076.1 apolipoprotein N-acyltransferase [Thermodesulfobacterium sp. TA1]